MTIRVKNGAAWVAPVASGKLAVKWGGTSWLYPSKAKVKWGSGWVDTDYVGYPAEPVNFAVNSWNYDVVTMKWGAGSGGAPITSYEIQMRNQSGGVISTLTDTTSPSSNFAVAHSTKYQFYVRAKSSSTLYSDWTGPVKVSIGKPSSYYETTEDGSRAWSKAASVIGYKDAPVGPYVPASVVVSSIRYQISNSGWTSALSPWNNREIRPWLLSGDNYAVFQWLSQSVDVTVAHNFWDSAGGVQGMICRGAGWSTAATGTYVATGTITVAGTEYYQYQQGHTIPAVPNGYW